MYTHHVYDYGSLIVSINILIFIIVLLFIDRKYRIKTSINKIKWSNNIIKRKST